MADESNTPARPTPEIEAEARMLIDCVLEDRITPEQGKRLEQLVVEHPSVARLYLEVVHIWYSIPLHLSRASLKLKPATDPQDSGAPMDESMVLPALHEENLVDFEELAITLPPPPPSPMQTVGGKWSKPLWWGSSAAALLIGLSIFFLVDGGQKTPPGPHPVAPAPQPIAVVTPVFITATAGVHEERNQSFSPGTALEIGQPVQFTNGAVELTFPTGAVALVQGPARFSLIDRNSIAMETGTITAHVPPTARGFKVTSPGLCVVDQGTSFGIRSLAGGNTSETHIFEGNVDVTGIDAAGKSISPVTHATAGQAFQHDVATMGPLLAVPFAPKSFNRDIAAVRLPVPLHDTGAGLPAGAVDPWWQIVSVPGDTNWKPRNAMVMGGLDASYTTDVGGGNWIGINSTLDNQPVGTFVFRTSVDLADFDLNTVSIKASLNADDYVSDILVNGVSTALSSAFDNPGNFFSKTVVTFPPNTQWHKGMNTIDIVVVNKVNQNNPNGMLMHLAWTATGSATVRR